MSQIERYGDPCRDCSFAWDLDLADAQAVVLGVPADYRAALAGLDGSQQHADLGWSAHGYVCHVADNLRIWAQRLAGGTSTITQYDADLLGRAKNYGEGTLTGALWALDSAVGDWELATTTAAAGGVVLRHPTRGPLSVTEVARGNAHDAFHHGWDIRRSVAGPRQDRPPRPHRVVITGGARSGKSVEAERRLAAEPHVTYVATSLPRPDDESWAERVALHRVRRPRHWTTIETVDLAPLLADPAAVLLIDCATLWLGAHIDSPSCAADIEALLAAWRSARCRVVFVTNEVGSSIHPPTDVGRRFADELGRLNARLAEAAEEVWLVVAGQPLQLKG